MKKFFGSIGHVFKVMGAFVGHEIASWWPSGEGHVVAAGFMAFLDSELGKLAWEAVQEVEGLASGAENRATAFANIVARAQLAGKSFETNLINLAIEVALSVLRKQFGAQEPVPAEAVAGV